MAVIQSKRRAVIQKGTSYSYNAETFEDHKVANFIEIDDPQVILDRFSKKDLFVFDTETFAVRIANHEVPTNIVRRHVGTGSKAVPQDFPFCMSFCDGEVAWSIYDTLDNNFMKFKTLAPLFENPDTAKVAHNAKYDLNILKNIGIDVKGTIHDTLIIAKLVDENRKSFKLMDLVPSDVGIVKFEYMVDNYKKTYKVSDYSQINRDLMTQYANADVWNCWHLFQREYPMLKTEGVEDYYKIEHDLLKVCLSMERHGMRLDLDYEKPLKERLQKAVDESEQAIYDEAGELFNINSGAQIHRVLLKLGVSPTTFSYTDKGNPKMDKFELERLGEQEGISLVSKILTYRKNTKLLTTYATGIYHLRDSEGKVHASINQGAADTGRFSITAPALQTLGKKDTTIRKAFIPSDGFDLFFFDLDSIEYKLYAHYSKIEGLIENMKHGFDAHTATASLLFNVPLDEVQKDQRTKAKTVNFALLYGAGNATLAANLGITTTEASALKQKYFANLPGSKEFVDTVQTVCKMRGCIKMYLGRKRRLKPDECYKAVNSLMQGGCATYIKQAMVRIHKYLVANNFKTRLVNTIHDELIFEVHQSETDVIVPIIRGLMEDHIHFRVPITAGVEKGMPNWGDKEDFTDKYPAKIFTQEELDAIDAIVLE